MVSHVKYIIMTCVTVVLHTHKVAYPSSKDLQGNVNVGQRRTVDVFCVLNDLLSSAIFL